MAVIILKIHLLALYWLQAVGLLATLDCVLHGLEKVARNPLQHVRIKFEIPFFTDLNFARWAYWRTHYAY